MSNEKIATILSLETDDYQKRGGNYPASGIPDTIDVYKDSDRQYSIAAEFKNTPENKAKSFMLNLAKKKGLTVVGSPESWQNGDYVDDWVTAVIYVSVE